VHPLRADIPILLGAEGPKNVALAAEIADGWIPLFFAPRAMTEFERHLAEGFAREGARRRPEEFEVLAVCPIRLDDDVERAADALRPMVALYAGGMGAKEANFHFDMFCRLGYEAEATKIQELYLSGHQRDAIATVPTRMVEDIALIGPREKVRDQLEEWRESIATTLLVSGDVAALRDVAELVG
jgi:alkanesulfonate monooxygenase SsuD/methylene tetrahydromethanopterin reductase-like flavin-dependent oxidoreductase (luciferase family)